MPKSQISKASWCMHIMHFAAFRSALFSFICFVVLHSFASFLFQASYNCMLTFEGWSTGLETSQSELSRFKDWFSVQDFFAYKIYCLTKTSCVYLFLLTCSSFLLSNHLVNELATSPEKKFCSQEISCLYLLNPFFLLKAKRKPWN